MITTLEEVYTILNTIKKQVDTKKGESFDNKAVFKFLYNSLLDLIDDLEVTRENDELFDEDENFHKEEEKKINKVEEDTWDNIMNDLID
jgi:transposase